MTLLPDQFGPVPPALLAAGAAMLILVTAFGAAWLAARFAGPRLAPVWSRIAGSRIEGMADRMCGIARYVVFSVIMAIALKSQNWSDIPKITMGVPLSIAVGLLVASVGRGLHLPRWAAGGLAIVAFITTLADVLDGLAAISALLDQVGITVGDTRLSLLSLTRFTIAVLILFAVFKLASRIINQSNHPI